MAVDNAAMFVQLPVMIMMIMLDRFPLSLSFELPVKRVSLSGKHDDITHSGIMRLSPGSPPE